MKQFMKLMCLSIGFFALIVFGLSACSPTEHSLRSRVIKLTGDAGLCSGEQIHAPSGQDYILTASHCKPLAKDGSILATTEDGRSLLRRVIAEDPASDLLLLEGVPHMRGLDIAKYANKQEHIRTFTHGHRFATYKTEGHFIDYATVGFQVEDSACESGMPKYEKRKYSMFGIEMEVCVLSETMLATDALIVPGSSGGMVINDSGDLVGVVSAGGDGFGYLIPPSAINAFVRNY